MLKGYRQNPDVADEVSFSHLEISHLLFYHLREITSQTTRTHLPETMYKPPFVTSATRTQRKSMSTSSSLVNHRGVSGMKSASNCITYRYKSNEIEIKRLTSKMLASSEVWMFLEDFKPTSFCSK